MNQTTTPGFIDAHSHLRSTTPESHGVPGASLEESLLRMMAMTTVPAVDDAFVACSDLVAAGVTGVQVMFHTFEDSEDYLDSLGELVSGIRASGIRALVVLGLTDQAEFAPLGRPTSLLPGWASVTRGITPEEFPEVFAEAVRRHPEVAFGVGPVGPQWSSDALMDAVAEVARSGCRIHTHCLESARQRDWAGENPLTRLSRHGLLGPRTSLAHGVWLDPEDEEVIAESGAQVVTCPHSNRLLGAGQAPARRWRAAGIPVAIGVDSSQVPPRPFPTALSVFEPADALEALTTSGQVATGLATDEDSVGWVEGPGSGVWEVRIGNRVLVREGEHVLRGEIEDARARITRVMAADEAARLSRQADISAILPAYLDHIDAK